MFPVQWNGTQQLSHKPVSVYQHRSNKKGMLPHRDIFRFKNRWCIHPLSPFLCPIFVLLSLLSKSEYCHIVNYSDIWVRYLKCITAHTGILATYLSPLVITFFHVLFFFFSFLLNANYGTLYWDYQQWHFHPLTGNSTIAWMIWDTSHHP